MNKYIDIHSHLIPQFDDGPKDYRESLEMLQQAADQGITDVFATSHFNEWIPETAETEYFEKLSQLKDKATEKKIPINIHSGAEIFYHQYVENTVKKSKVTTLGNWGQYVLLEFPMFQMPDGAEEVLFRLAAEKFIGTPRTICQNYRATTADFKFYSIWWSASSEWGEYYWSFRQGNTETCHSITGEGASSFYCF